MRMPPQKSLIPFCSPVPALILHKAVVRPQVHGHRPSAVRTVRHQFGGHPHVGLLPDHAANNLLILPGFLTAGFGALEQTVVPLGIEQPLFLKARLLKAVIHVGGQDKIILFLKQLKQRFIYGLRRVHIAVDIDITTPVRPVFLQRIIGIKATGIHIMEAVFFLKIRKIHPEAFPAVGEARGSGQSRSRAHQHSVGLPKHLLQTFCLFLYGLCGFCLPAFTHS